MSKTKEKLYVAAAQLFSSKGFDSTTTKEIAELAGVSEMTLFRQFKTKENLFREVGNKYVFEPTFGHLFKDQLTYDLVTDFTKVAMRHHEVLTKNKRMVLMNMRSASLHVGDEPDVLDIPMELHKHVVQYIRVMQKKGLVVDQNPETLSTGFLALAVGTFLMESFFTSQLVDSVSLGKAVENYCKGISKSS